MGHNDGIERLNTVNPLIHMCAGGATGIAEHCIMFPLDSVKTRLQSLCPCPESKCSTVFSSLVNMMKSEGLFKPLRGISAVALGAAPAHALYFSTYEGSKAILSRFSPNSLPNAVKYGVSGVLATLVHDAIMNPFEVIKQRMQMIYSPYGNSLECVKCIYKLEGIGAFYRSYAIQLMMNIPFQAVHFVAYEYTQDVLNPSHQYRPVSHFISGGIAGGLAAAVTTPLDCIKTVVNTQQVPRLSFIENSLIKNMKNGRESPFGIADSISLIYKSRGLPGFFCGLRARVLFHVPSIAISWSVYEMFKYSLSIQSEEGVCSL